MPSAEDFQEFGRCFAYSAHRAERRMSAIYDAALAPAELTLRQFAVLAEAAFGGALPVARLAKRLAVDPTTLTRALKPLIARAWIQLEPDPADARVKRVVATPAGIARIDIAAPFWRAAQATVADALGHAQAQALAQALDDAARRLKSFQSEPAQT